MYHFVVQNWIKATIPFTIVTELKKYFRDIFSHPPSKHFEDVMLFQVNPLDQQDKRKNIQWDLEFFL